MTTFILFVIGFIILVKGADFLIAGARSVARFFGISPWVIGLTIVGIGTSIPEFSISFLANLVGKGDISMGTILGSNTFNLLFILGLAAIISPMFLKKEWITRDLVVNAGTILISLFIARDGITRVEGIVLLLLFAAWLWWVVHNTPRENHDHKKKDFHQYTIPISILLILGGIIGVYVGARWVIDGASAFAALVGVSEALISLTAIAIGTSLPELTVSMRAALKGNSAIAVGNIIGSNVFDFFGIFGINALVRPMIVSGGLFIDGIITFSAAVLIFIVAVAGERMVRGQFVIRRKEGILLLFAYLAYFGFRIFSG